MLSVYRNAHFSFGACYGSLAVVLYNRRSLTGYGIGRDATGNNNLLVLWFRRGLWAVPLVSVCDENTTQTGIIFRSGTTHIPEGRGVL